MFAGYGRQRLRSDVNVAVGPAFLALFVGDNQNYGVYIFLGTPY